MTTISVTPFVGVWIEIGMRRKRLIDANVTPFVGVWIEICGIPDATSLPCSSLPSWECGLKFYLLKQKKTQQTVTPFVGVWIEMPLVMEI